MRSTRSSAITADRTARASASIGCGCAPIGPAAGLVGVLERLGTVRTVLDGGGVPLPEGGPGVAASRECRTPACAPSGSRFSNPMTSRSLLQTTGVRNGARNGPDDPAAVARLDDLQLRAVLPRGQVGLAEQAAA